MSEEPTIPTPTELEGLLERASVKRLIADTYHTRDYAGREHGFLRCEGELVPLAGFVLRVEGMPQDQGAARLRLVAAAVNALPSLLARIKELEAVVERIASGDEPRTAGEKWRKDGQPSTLDQCSHGRMMRQDCGNCTAEFARAALNKDSTHAG